MQRKHIRQMHKNKTLRGSLASKKPALQNHDRDSHEVKGQTCWIFQRCSSFEDPQLSSYNLGPTMSQFRNLRCLWQFLARNAKRNWNWILKDLAALKAHRLYHGFPRNLAFLEFSSATPWISEKGLIWGYDNRSQGKYCSCLPTWSRKYIKRTWGR